MNPSNAGSNSHLHEVIFTDRHYINKLDRITAFINFLEKSPRLPSQNFFMLIRPRGFGLSLASEAIESLLMRDELLLDHLAMKESTNFNVDDIGHYPVLHFSFTLSKANSLQAVEKMLGDSLQTQIWEHHIKLKTDGRNDLRRQMLQLILEVSDKEKSPVAILVDNYDVPLYMISAMEKASDREQAIALYFDMLSAFRQAGNRVKFCLLTGHVKFALSNNFSEGLPHVIDLSFSDIASELMGFTIDEIKNTYGADLARIAPQQGVTAAEYLDALEHCYGGFVFSDKMKKVLCPLSVTRALDNDGDLYAYSGDNNYNFLSACLDRETPNLDWLIEKDGQDQLYLEEVDLFPEGKQIGSLLLQQGLFSCNKVTFADREHSISWRYKYGFTNVEMRRIFQILTGISDPELRELPINTRVYDAGEEDYLIKSDDK